MGTARRGARPRTHETDLATIRKTLEAERQRRSSEVSELTVHLYDHAGAVALAEGHLGVERGVLEVQLAGARRGLAETEAALQRLAEGSYGICEGCGQPISPQRLEVLPQARLCASCQGRASGSRR